MSCLENRHCWVAVWIAGKYKYQCVNCQKVMG